MEREGTFSSPPISFPIDACNAGYHNSIQMLFSRWKHSKVTFSLADTKMRAPFVLQHSLNGNRKYICYITSLLSTIVWCLAMCVCLTWRLTTNKDGRPAAAKLLSAIYKPFITLVCLLSKLFPYHWWQYFLLILNLNEMQEKTYLKVVLLGKVNSGKTCLVTRYITRSFSEETPSVSKFFFFNNFYYYFKLLLLYV